MAAKLTFPEILRNNFRNTFSVYFLNRFIFQISLFLYAEVSTFPSNVETNFITRDGQVLEHDNSDQTVTTTELPQGSEKHVLNSDETDLIDSTTASSMESNEPTSEPTIEPVNLSDLMFRLHFMSRPSCGCMFKDVQRSMIDVPRPSCGCRPYCPYMARNGFHPTYDWSMQSMPMPMPMPMQIPISMRMQTPIPMERMPISMERMLMEPMRMPIPMGPMPIPVPPMALMSSMPPKMFKINLESVDN